MMVKYIVSCYSQKLSIDNGDDVIVSPRTIKGTKVVAQSVTNITKKGIKCDCGMPPKALIAEKPLKGKASNVEVSDMGVQFDLETS